MHPSKCSYSEKTYIRSSKFLYSEKTFMHNSKFLYSEKLTGKLKLWKWTTVKLMWINLHLDNTISSHISAQFSSVVTSLMGEQLEWWVQTDTWSLGEDWHTISFRNHLSIPEPCYYFCIKKNSLVNAIILKILPVIPRKWSLLACQPVNIFPTRI